MRGGRWAAAIGAWAACTVALSLFGMDRVEQVRRQLIAGVRPAPSASSATSPSAAAAAVLLTPGGSIVARCDKGKVWVDWLSPAPGFSVQDADPTPAAAPKVTFRSNTATVRVVVRCVADAPQADVYR